MGQINTEEEMPKCSHPTHQHPLEPSVHETRNISCSGCQKDIPAGKNFYTCGPCSFSLHRACYNMETRLHHPAEPGIDLILRLLPSFNCRACGVQDSAGFCYHSSASNTYYHALCLKMPLRESCDQDDHELVLQFTPPYGEGRGFRCDICRAPGFTEWLYRCSVCAFDVHLNCIYAAPKTQAQTPNISNLTCQPPVTVAGNQIPTGYVNSFPIVQPQSPNPSALSTTARDLATPWNMNQMHFSPKGPLGNTTSNVNPSLSVPYVNYANNTGSYVLNPGASVQPVHPRMGVPQFSNLPNLVGAPGMGVPQFSNLPNHAGAPGMGVPQFSNLPNHVGAPGIGFGTGMAAMVATGVFTGIGEGVGQEAVQGVFNAFSNDGSSTGDGSALY